MLELIRFLNVKGPLPEGHTWQFVIDDCLLELPAEKMGAVRVGLPGQGVFHGTLPTSNTEDTYQHGHFGSALITKRSVC